MSIKNTIHGDGKTCSEVLRLLEDARDLYQYEAMDALHEPLRLKKINLNMDRSSSGT